MEKFQRHETVYKNGVKLEHLSFRTNLSLEQAKRKVICEVDGYRLDGGTVEVLDGLTYIETDQYRPNIKRRIAYREWL